jgi:DHA1 family multidrug resistance protein-like MFS transporter
MNNWRAVNGLFLTTTILEGLAFGHVIAFSPLFLSELGLSPAEISAWTGFLYALMAGVAFPLAPFWGALAERYSRRLVIVRSQYLEALAYFMLALAPDMWWVLASRLLLGLTFGNISVVIATQALVTPRKHVGTAIAVIQAAMPIAASIGPPAGAGLIDLVGVRGLFMIDGLMALAAGLMVTFLMREPAKTPGKASVLSRTGQVMAMVWQRPVLRWNFLCLFLTVGSRAVVDVYLPVRITELSPDPAPVIGYVLGIAGVLTAVATFASAKLVDDAGGIRWMAPLMILAAVLTFGMAVLPSVWAIAALTWARALPFAASNTLLVAHLTRVLRPGDQTAILSLTPMPRNTAMFALPIVAAVVAPLGVGVALSIGAAAYLASAAVSWLAEKASPAEIEAIRLHAVRDAQSHGPAT